MTSIIVAQAAIGAFNVHMDYRWTYAGTDNPLLATLLDPLHLAQDWATPIFTPDLRLNGVPAAVELVAEFTVVLGVFLLGLVMASRAAPAAEPSGVTPGDGPAATAAPSGPVEGEPTGVR
jgi:hypothetical protein